MDRDEVSLPWLDAPLERARAALARGRLGHAVLIHAAPGLGAEILAQRLAMLVLCEATTDRPCGRCASCQLFTAHTHPDFHWIEIDRAEKATQIKVEQIRGLAETLALKSYRGGFKVAVVAEADAMNANASNALLKTLEEPPPSTLLVLCAARPSRLPPTIVSRCHRLSVSVPSRTVSLAWLKARKPLDAWPKLLDLAGGAPLRALELEGSGVLELDGEMAAALERLAAGKLDLLGTAERWAKEDLELRLAWLEAWLGSRIRAGLAPAAHLPARGGIRNIRGLYALLDRVRALKLELATPLNRQLATEDLLVRAELVLAA
jgi:DNA polymerase-3 subunit delta'